MNQLKIAPIQIIKDENKEIFRQTRFLKEDENIIISIEKNFYEIVNWSRTGVAFESDENLNLSVGDEIKNICIKAFDIDYYSGNITIRSKSEVNDRFRYGVEFSSHLFPVEALDSVSGVNQCFKAIDEMSSFFSEVSPDVTRVILQLAETLRLIKNSCEQEEERLKKIPYDIRVKTEVIFLKEMTKKVTSFMCEYNKKISEGIDVEKLPENSPYHKLFGEYIYPYFASADISRRAKEKPLGYAGDYEMMNQIYRNGYEGRDLLGKVIHNYIINEASSESVKFRKPYFTGFYKETLKNNEGKVNILSLASGPCVEFQDIIRDFPQDDLSRINMTLFDLDRESLEHAHMKIFECCKVYNKEVNIKIYNASIKSFLSYTKDESGSFDLIYSGGLFDYLDNVTSTVIVTNLYKFLAPNGKLIIGNFTKDNTTKAFCHLVTDWHLIHKTEEEIKGWAKNIKDCSYEIEYDSNHINAFIVITKK